LGENGSQKQALPERMENNKMKHLAMVLTFIISAFLVQTPSSMAETQETIILDVRTPAEVRESRIQDSINIDFLDGSFQEKVSRLDKDKTYKVYCRSGNRSGKAKQLMESIGFKHVENLGSLGEAAKKLNRSCEGKPC
jgi:rhodanese-related sulfurtransferase